MVPLDAKGHIDEAELARYISVADQRGPWTAIATGSTGEFLRFTVEERRAGLWPSSARPPKDVCRSSAGWQAESTVAETIAACDHRLEIGVRGGGDRRPVLLQALSGERLRVFSARSPGHSSIDITLYNIPMLGVADRRGDGSPAGGRVSPRDRHQGFQRRYLAHDEAHLRRSAGSARIHVPERLGLGAGCRCSSRRAATAARTRRAGSCRNSRERSTTTCGQAGLDTAFEEQVRLTDLFDTTFRGSDFPEGLRTRGSAPRLRDGGISRLPATDSPARAERAGQARDIRAADRALRRSVYALLKVGPGPLLADERIVFACGAWFTLSPEAGLVALLVALIAARGTLADRPGRPSRRRTLEARLLAEGRAGARRGGTPVRRREAWGRNLSWPPRRLLRLPCRGGTREQPTARGSAPASRRSIPRRGTPPSSSRSWSPRRSSPPALCPRGRCSSTMVGSSPASSSRRRPNGSYSAMWCGARQAPPIRCLRHRKPASRPPQSIMPAGPVPNQLESRGQFLDLRANTCSRSGTAGASRARRARALARYHRGKIPGRSRSLGILLRSSDAGDIAVGPAFGGRDVRCTNGIADRVRRRQRGVRRRLSSRPRPPGAGGFVTHAAQGYFRRLLEAARARPPTPSHASRGPSAPGRAMPAWQGFEPATTSDPNTGSRFDGYQIRPALPCGYATCALRRRPADRHQRRHSRRGPARVAGCGLPRSGSPDCRPAARSRWPFPPRSRPAFAADGSPLADTGDRTSRRDRLRLAAVTRLVRIASGGIAGVAAPRRGGPRGVGRFRESLKGTTGRPPRRRVGARRRRAGRNSTPAEIAALVARPPVLDDMFPDAEPTHAAPEPRRVVGGEGDGGHGDRRVKPCAERPAGGLPAERR